MTGRTMAVCALLSFSAGLMADEVEEAAVGQPAPDFTATGIDGRTFRLSDKLKSGEQNVVLLFSRASW